MKIILFLVDGMRPDGIEEIEIAQKIIGESTYTMNGETVFPSVTLPCHMSLFHSVVPERHGVTTNVYVPQVRPVNGLFEVLKQNGKKCASFYSWEELRDVSRPGSPAISCLFSGKSFGYETASQLLTDSLIQSVRSFDLDFCFLYFGDPDEKGHKYGWMSSEYHRAVQLSWNCIDKVIRELGDEYTYMITADHGGHERSHGTMMPEDMKIPIILRGKDWKAGAELKKAGILDLAPTVTKLFGIDADEDWEGIPLF